MIRKLARGSNLRTWAYTRSTTSTGLILARYLSASVVKSPYHCKSLTDETTSTSLSRFIFKNFQKEDVRNKPALIDGSTGKSATFGELYTMTNQFAHSLQEMGFVKNDCIAIMSPNSTHYFTSFLGISMIGAISTTLNPLYSMEEITFQLENTGAKMVIVHPLCLDRVKPVADQLSIPIISLGSGDAASGVMSIEDIIAAADSDVTVTTQVDPDSVLTIPFSSGTTGVPKGVVLTHRNVVSNLIQLMPGHGRFYKSHSVALVPLPFFHIFGMVVGMMLPAILGSTCVFLPAFDLPVFLELVQKHKASHLYVVPPIILALAKHPLVANYDMSSVQVILSGAAPLGSDVQEEAAKRLNCTVTQAWGMTELSPAGAVTSEDEVVSVKALKGSSGRLVCGTEAKIVDPATGEDKSALEEGELLIRGPQVMKGYWNNPEATRNTITEDGFLRTGDIAHFDEDGWLFITDRCKELIKYKGFQVPPAELEAIMTAMPSIKDVVVIPVLDDEAGEIPRAYIVKQDGPVGDELTAQMVLDTVHARVAPHKKLRGGVYFVDAIPRSASGKLLRRVQVEMDRANPPPPMTSS